MYASRDVSKWTENIRKWTFTYILATLNKRIEENKKAFMDNGVNEWLYFTRNIPGFESKVFQISILFLDFNSPMNPTICLELTQKFKAVSICYK
jgi:hypothetical protein